jgi:hypothetical protein
MGWSLFHSNFSKNYTVMKDVGDITRLKPDSRVNSLMRFNSRLMGHPEVITRKWRIGNFAIDWLFSLPIFDRLWKNSTVGVWNSAPTWSNARPAWSPRKPLFNRDLIRLKMATGPIQWEVGILVDFVFKDFFFLDFLTNFPNWFIGQRMAVTTSLRDWIAIYPSQMEAEVKQFVEMFRQVGRDMGFDIPNPRM